MGALAGEVQTEILKQVERNSLVFLNKESTSLMHKKIDQYLLVITVEIN